MRGMPCIHLSSYEWVWWNHSLWYKARELVQLTSDPTVPDARRRHKYGGNPSYWFVSTILSVMADFVLFYSSDSCRRVSICIVSRAGSYPVVRDTNVVHIRCNAHTEGDYIRSGLVQFPRPPEVPPLMLVLLYRGRWRACEHFYRFDKLPELRKNLVTRYIPASVPRISLLVRKRLAVCIFACRMDWTGGVSIRMWIRCEIS